jgi:hypothetical protein
MYVLNMQLYNSAVVVSYVERGKCEKVVFLIEKLKKMKFRLICTYSVLQHMNKVVLCAQKICNICNIL